MSVTDPLLKHARPAARSGSVAKIFFTAHELLQHVRDTYHHISMDTGSTSREKNLLHAMSPSLYVSYHTSKTLSNNNQTQDIPDTFKQAETKLDIVQPFERNCCQIPQEDTHHHNFSNGNARTSAKIKHCSLADECDSLLTSNTARTVTLLGPVGNRSLYKSRILAAGNGGGCRRKYCNGAVRNEYNKGQQQQTHLLENSSVVETSKSVGTRLGPGACGQPQNKTWCERYRERGTNEGRPGSKRCGVAKMSSLDSPRTQCCCCVVGVFAAMFGIFMLSAGICIVLNVTFMEVDTSGLPPDLRNANGKKVVGIILICVAITFLGLSATVSIVYFTLCHRKSSGGTQPHRTGTVRINAGQEHGHHRDSASTSARRVTSTIMDSVDSHGPGMHHHSEFLKRKSHRRLRNHPTLPPHQEEEPDLAKSDTEGNRSQWTYLASNSNHEKRMNQQKSKRHKSPESHDVQIMSNAKVPAIVVSSSHENLTLVNGEVETQLHESVSTFDEDSLCNACSERCEVTASDVVFQTDTLSSECNINTPVAYSEGLTSMRQADVLKSSEEPYAGLPHDINITHLASGFIQASCLCPSVPELKRHVLVVQPAIETHHNAVREGEQSSESLSCVSDDQGTQNGLHEDNRSHVHSALYIDEHDAPHESELV